MSEIVVRHLVTRPPKILPLEISNRMIRRFNIHFCYKYLNTCLGPSRAIGTRKMTQCQIQPPKIWIQNHQHPNMCWYQNLVHLSEATNDQEPMGVKWNCTGVSHLQVWRKKQAWGCFYVAYEIICDIWDTDYNTDNWEPGFMTIFVTWQLIVTLAMFRTVTLELPPTSRTGRNNSSRRKRMKINVQKTKGERAKRIIGGKESGFHHHPWQVKLCSKWRNALLSPGCLLETVRRCGWRGGLSGGILLRRISHCHWLDPFCCSLLSY